MISGLLAQSLTIAALVWGQPACGQVSVSFQDLGPYLGITTLNGQGNETIPPCTMLLDRVMAETEDVLACSIVVHEWGHLTGQKHSQDPRNVMYPVPAQPYWRCRDRWRQYFADIGGTE